MPDTASQSQAPLLSGSLAMALFPAYFIDQTVEPRKARHPPCQTDVGINIVQLYYELPIISLWYLREHNFIRFVQSTSPHGHSAVGIEAVQAKQPSVPGVEFDLWEIIKASAPGTPVQAVVRPLFGPAEYYPEVAIRERITDWLIQLGYGQPDPNPKPRTGFFRTGVYSLLRTDRDIRLFEFYPDCQRIMEQQQTARMIQQRWLRFVADESDLYQWLFQGVIRAGDDACSSGIRNRHSIYCSYAEEHHEGRSQHSKAQTPGRGMC